MLIDLRNLLSGAKDDMTVSAPLEMETFRTALAEYPVMEKQPVELVLTRTGKDKLHISGNGFVALEIPCDRCLEPVRTEMHFDIDKDIDMQETSGEIEDEEEKDYIDGYNLDVDKLVFGEILLLIKDRTNLSPKYARSSSIISKDKDARPGLKVCIKIGRAHV